MVVESEVVKVGLSEASNVIIGTISLTAIVMLWMINRFQTKKAAAAQLLEVNTRITENKSEIKEATILMHKIDRNLEYIKGRVEPK